MKRNVIFFLDLVVQVLAVMIVMTALAARQPDRVGLVRPGADYMTVEVEYAADLPSGAVAAAADPAAVSVAVVRQPGTTTVVVSARRYRDGPAVWPLVVKVDPGVLKMPFRFGRVSTHNRPTPEPLTGPSLADLNKHGSVETFLRFVP